MADIGAIKPLEGTLEILHPATEVKLGITISILSIRDDKLKKLRRKMEDTAIKLRQKGKTFSSAEIENNRNELLFAAMTGWSWSKPTIGVDEKTKEPIIGEQPDFHGNSNPPFNQETVFQVFNELPWFRDQVEEKADETKSFFQA